MLYALENDKLLRCFGSGGKRDSSTSIRGGWADQGRLAVRPVLARTPGTTRESNGFVTFAGLGFPSQLTRLNVKLGGRLSIFEIPKRALHQSRARDQLQRMMCANFVRIGSCQAASCDPVSTRSGR